MLFSVLNSDIAHNGVHLRVMVMMGEHNISI